MSRLFSEVVDEARNGKARPTSITVEVAERLVQRAGTKPRARG